MTKEYSILIGGAAGEGSKKAGLIIAKFFSHLGYKIYIYEDYQSLIKGGHNFSIIRACFDNVSGIRDKIDFLLALNQETAQKHKHKLKNKNYVVYNADSFSLNKGIGINIEKITKDNGGIPIMKNTALVAAFGKIIGIDWSIVEKVLKQELPVSLDLNLKIAKYAYNNTENIVKIEKGPVSLTPLLSGNEAIALGGLEVGLEAFVGYPMTPATGILNYLSLVSIDYKLKVFQPENEIAVVNMALGLAFSGTKTMVATSGGGFALMNEGISLSAQSETPLLIIEGQRMGPSTGIPTYGGQSDLLYVLSSGHGDFSRLVLAPGNASEAFYLTGMALGLSWKYQIPSIVLSDKDLCESTYSFDKKEIESFEPILWNKKGKYLRYKITKDGISPLAFPGVKNIKVKATSYEHDESGISIEDEKAVQSMQDKRTKKIVSLEKEMEKIKCVLVRGNKKAKTAVIAWGSTAGPTIEACDKLGLKMIQPLVFQPFPKKQMIKALLGVEKIICVEMNSYGQLAFLLNSYDIKVSKKILKYTGRPFTVDELIKKLK